MFSLENLCASGCAVFLEDFRGEEFEIRPKISEEARVGFVLWTILVHSKINGKNCCSLVGYRCVSRCSLVFQSIGTRFDVCIGELVRTSGCAQYGCLLFLYFVRGKKILQPTMGLETCKMQQLASTYTDKTLSTRNQKFPIVTL